MKSSNSRERVNIMIIIRNVTWSFKFIGDCLSRHLEYSRRLYTNKLLRNVIKTTVLMRNGQGETNLYSLRRMVPFNTK